MNKGKLRSLMFHAGFCNEDGGWDNRPIFEQEHDNFQRFAELIVRECATAVNNVPLGYSDYHRSLEEAMRNDCVAAVYKHFGLNKE